MLKSVVIKVDLIRDSVRSVFGEYTGMPVPRVFTVNIYIVAVVYDPSKLTGVKYFCVEQ
jgi:hypothetical protein